ncbi:MAG: type I 3-dehydroquinate dehydratase [Dehalococcoidia bacterium]|nr:type I 3-dehydroquinate dehydratase [Dehalococcoidia bacterium]
MDKPKICASIVNGDLETIERVSPLVDLFEVRIDLIGPDWREVAGQLRKPWVACNRKSDEGGIWEGSEEERIAELLSALELGAAIVDIELSTGNLNDVVTRIKRQAECLISFHELEGTPPFNTMREIAQRQLAAGADIVKVVTTARKFEDNVSTMQLIQEFPGKRVVAFAMGPPGLVSRLLCPLVGGEFVYASVASDGEAAPGQMTAEEMRQIYEMVRR